MIRYHTTLFKLCQIVMCMCIIVLACKQTDTAEEDLSRYYFPVESFPEEGMVYTYKNVQDATAAPEVWRHLKRGPGLIESINYGFGDDIVQRQYDRIVSNGVITDSLKLYASDTAGQREQINVLLPSPFRFPFQPGDSSSVWLTKMEWWQPEDSLHIVLERRRTFKEYTSWHYEGKEIPAVRFTTEDTFETESDGWTTTRWGGEELYARDIGLVYYKRVISENMLLEFELESRE
jgi:hypothetical protein